jgi:hypothetical protein
MGRGAQGYLLFAYGLVTAALIYLAAAFLLGSREVYEFARRVPVVRSRLMAAIEPRYRLRRR